MAPVFLRGRGPVRCRGFARRSFTLAELMVSVAVLLILMAMVGWIFATATRSIGMATANNELMGNARAAEGQFSKDFGGMLKDRFIGIWYQLTESPPGSGRYLRTDRMVFFEAGDFSTIRQTDLNTPPGPIRSSIARVFYGHELNALGRPELEQRILARRVKLLATQTPTNSLAVPPAYGSFVLPASGIDGSGTLWDGSQDLFDDWEYEFQTLDDWHNIAVVPITYFFALGSNPGLMVENPTAAPTSWIRRPRVTISSTPTRQGGTQMLLLPGCAEFKIQRWIERDPATGVALGPSSPSSLGMPRWWPEEDQDGNGIVENTTTSNDFAAMSAYTTEQRDIREYFNGPHPQMAGSTGSVDIGHVDSANSNSTWYAESAAAGRWLYYDQEDAPKAIKITIRLFDPNRRIPDGQVITMTFGLQ